ncbi:tyrosine-protein phosphatase [Oceanobacillus longus]|uniref:Tyrosine-protein phosphatase n=1 Tax=Oceanobacillus longus TaxID=930120 RepID=A0ABV8GZS8_9BACI
MELMKTANKPFDLQGTVNTRELGGYSDKKLNILNKQKLLRSDLLSNLTKEDSEWLYKYNIRTVVDLRREREIREEPSKLEHFRDVNYFNISLSTNDSGLMEDRKIDSLSALYQTYLTERQIEIKEIMEIISKSLSGGGVIFNCMAGKDRTGIISMLLLKICDVDHEIIKSDYEVSEGYIINYLNEKKHEFNDDFPDFLLRSERIEMEKTLSFMEANYGTVENYMEHIRVKSEVLNTIRTNLIG